MNKFIEIKSDELKDSVFKLIGKDWMLITAEKDGKVNTMTASWGALGIMWGKEVAFIGIRPQRFTKEFVDHKGEFTLTFFNDEYKKELTYLGTVSGKDEDKILKSGLSVDFIDNKPYFKEGKLVLSCKKLYSQYLDPKNFTDEALTICDKFYPEKDFHEIYVAEIEKILLEK